VYAVMLLIFFKDDPPKNQGSWSRRSNRPSNLLGRDSRP